ncbi:DUF397 domain-containing protein [Streptomyces sp. NPDC002513]
MSRRPAGVPTAGTPSVRSAAVDGIHVRDSKVRSGPVLTVTPDAWAGFVGLAADQTI